MPLQTEGRNHYLVSLNGCKVCRPDGNTRYHEGFIEDITARKQADIERERLWAQLAQAQNMESVGWLAGSVAHDFNNLLTVINGHTRLGLSKLEDGNPLRHRLQEILKAGERAANLTQQLLAFSRKQVLQPCIFDLKQVVSQMRSMLEHLMGDYIDLRFVLGAGKIPVFADSHQLEQVVMNLAVNARDAMPTGGCLSIKTAVVDSQEIHALSGIDVPVAQYAMLRSQTPV
jgi:signal transduction histidine kinase